jgi:hypothetical protein
MLVQLVTTAEILAAKAGTLTWPTCLVLADCSLAWLACFGLSMCLLQVLSLKWIFYKMIYLEQSSFLRYLLVKLWLVWHKHQLTLVLA